MVDGEGRREQLVRAAYAHVARVGFEGLRLRRIAVDVGIDHSTLYHHLPTKQDVVKAVAQYATDQLRPTMPAIDDAREALRAHLRAIEELFDERPELAIVTAELDLRARRDPEVRAVMQAHEVGWRAALADLVDRGAQQGSWPGADRDTTVELVIATVKGARQSPSFTGRVLDRLATVLAASPGVPA